ncbi:MAG: methyltransferase domain-containing protein [Gammaproteobacteria bacterium]|nr:MAG: methyltransferase domain-containing protein [Gammaproteobacteria bacterium]
MTEKETYRLPPHPVLREYYPDEDTRRRKVRALFDASGAHYDWINSVMSLRTGERYRAEALERAGLQAGDKVVDVGCGTGVLAQKAAEIAGPEGCVIGVDPSPGMLAEARRRGVTVVVGRGEQLPLADGSADFLSMGYALRHVADLIETFAEYRRVLRPGGRLLLLEIAPPRSRLGHWFLRLYLKRIVPAITWLGTRNPQARLLMSYYWDTVEQCVPPEAILDALREAGFEEVKRHVLFGIFGEYTARRPEEEHRDTRTTAGEPA